MEKEVGIGGSGPRGAGGVGDAWWRYLDINGSYAFYGKRNKAVEKALCLSGILVTSQHKLNMGYDVIRLLTQLPCIC